MVVAIVYWPVTFGMEWHAMQAASKIGGTADWTSVCTGPIQDNLRYNLSSRPNQLGGPDDETEVSDSFLDVGCARYVL